MKRLKASSLPFVLPHNDFIRLRKNEKVSNFYDVELRHIENLKQYDSVECHVVVYPYSRNIYSHHIRFYPYEEYVKDILSRQKSAYTEMKSPIDKMFGILVGLIITLIFGVFKPDALLSVEAIVSIIGAYFVGKELWDEIENTLMDLSKSWSIRYLESYYAYELGKHTTLTNYGYFAKKQRYGKASLLPEKMDFIEKSNSQTVRMWFDTKELSARGDPSNHILSIHITPEAVQAFEQEGFLFGIKLSLNQRCFCGVIRSLELFQSVHNYANGCLDENGTWVEDGLFYRQTYSWGRLKWFFKSGILLHQAIIKHFSPS
jgi:hypothetical protein